MSNPAVVTINGTMALNGSLVVTKTSHFSEPVSGLRVRDWEGALVALQEQLVRLTNENDELKQLIRGMHTKTEMMYYAPGMPGFVEAEVRWNETGASENEVTDQRNAFGTA